MSIDWRADAACAGKDPELFFPKRRDASTIRDALAICGSCPVARQCLQFAQDNPDTSGVWGAELFTPPSVEPDPERAYKHGPDAVQAIRELYQQGLTYNEMAKRTGLTNRQVRHIATTFKINTRRTVESDKAVADRDSQILDLRASGASRAEIADLLGVSIAVVDNARRRKAAA